MKSSLPLRPVNNYLAVQDKPISSGQVRLRDILTHVSENRSSSCTGRCQDECQVLYPLSIDTPRSNSYRLNCTRTTVDVLMGQEAVERSGKHPRINDSELLGGRFTASPGHDESSRQEHDGLCTINPTAPSSVIHAACKLSAKSRNFTPWKAFLTSENVAFLPSTWYLLWLLTYAVRVTTNSVPGNCSSNVEKHAREAGKKRTK